MKDNIKEILEDYKKLAGEITLKLDNTAEYESWLIIQEYFDRLLDYITNLQEELEYVRKQNNDLRKIYRNTYKRYQEQGNDEMAGYFMAQIDECRTFYVEPVVDYYMLSKQLQKQKENTLDYVEHLIRDAKYHLNLGHLKKLKKLLQGDNNE